MDDITFDTPSAEQIDASVRKQRETVMMHRTRCDNLPSTSSVVVGLRDWVLRTASIRLRDTHSQSELADLGFDKLNTITDVYFDEIHDTIKKTPADSDIDWDDIVTYLDEIDGFGVVRACMLFYTATGRCIPSNVLAGVLIMENCIHEGLGGDEDFSTKGNTVIGRATLDWYFNSLGLGDTTLIDSLRTIKDKIEIVRDSSGAPAYFAEKYAYGGERRVVQLIGEEAEIPFGDYDSSDEDLAWFNEGQRVAIRSVLASRKKVVAITGAGGTGKTTTVRAIVRRLAKQYRVAILAPTGAAAKRIGEDVADVKSRLVSTVSTIHYHFFKLGSPDEQCPNLYIIDEASMVDSNTFGRLMQALRNKDEQNWENVRIILVGDFSQLPPVGAGQLFNDLVSGNRCPVFRLTQVMRTTDEDLLRFYDEVRNKKPISKTAHKFYQDYNDAGMAETIKATVERLFEEDPEWYRYTRIIAHRNATVDYVNALCHNKTNSGRYAQRMELGDPMKRGSWKKAEWKYVGAKVVFTKNDRNLEVVNGSIGYVRRLGQRSEGKHEGEPNVIVELEDGRMVDVLQKYGHVSLAYATSVHKCQGSECRVCIYIHTNTMETVELVYTAITRAKENLVVLCPRTLSVSRQEIPRETIINTTVEAR